MKIKYLYQVLVISTVQAQLLTHTNLMLMLIVHPLEHNKCLQQQLICTKDLKVQLVLFILMYLFHRVVQ